MPDQETVEQVQVSAEQPNTELSNVKVDPFGQGAWAETLPEPKKEESIPSVEIKKDEPITTQKTDDNEEILDPKDWLKREFEIEDPEVLKQQIKEYKELKAKPQVEETKWENEESKTINELLRTGKKKEVLQILALQDKLENLITNEVNEDNAVDIIKTGMQLKSKASGSELTSKEVDRLFNRKFQIPEKPSIEDVKADTNIPADNEESVYQDRLKKWQEQVDEINMDIQIEAKQMKPELLKAKVELKFPEIEKAQPEGASKPSPEAMKQMRDSFISKLESDYLKPEGFNTQVKDELVDFPVSFKIPDEEKKSIKSMLEGELDSDSSYISKRWFGENGEPKVEQIVADVYLLSHTDKVLSGIANNAANQRIVELRKQANNIDLKNQSHQNTFQPNADGKANISPFAKEAWSDKPPALV